MAMHNYLEGNYELNWLQFLANHQMQTLLLMEDNFSTALLGLPPNLREETTHIGGSEISAATEDANAILAGNLQNVQQQQHKHSAITNVRTVSCRTNNNLTESEPGSCVLPAFPSDPLLVERSAKSSPLLKEICQKAEESTAEAVTSGNSKERAFEFSLSGNNAENSHLKKRKAVQKTANSEAPKRKRLKGLKHKAEQTNNDDYAEKTEEANNLKAPPAQSEKPNYIHVRARRGEATDSHSLAERVRREKISERMKILQDLVPGCSKITGKALMLDKIINHVQCLQRQVEFLSVQLATLNPCIDNFCDEDIMTYCTRNGGTSWPYLHYQL